MEKDLHDNNVYAYDIENIARHISEVESGRKGYYCMGCGREMQAKKGEKRAYHFAHDPKDVLKKGKCVYSDETYRHQLAKEILQRIKQIKVPNLYKYPPSGIEGKANKLKDSWIVVADTVKIELTFYEDENGEIKFNDKIDSKGDDKFLLIKPDVTFFDKNGRPILLIEIVATHKIDKNKLIKIKQLGINMIQVTIPKDSPEEIEKTFFNTSRTEWIYNYEQEQSPYIPTTEGNNEGVSSSDEFQKRLFEAIETYECRASQINNLIRAISKCLESEQYRNFKQYTETEIQRVESNAKGNRIRLRELQKEHKRTIEGQLSAEEAGVKGEEEEFGKRQEEFSEKVRNYETRYINKSKELSELQKGYRPDSQEEIDGIEKDFSGMGVSSGTFEDRITEIRTEESRLEQSYIKQGEEIRREEIRFEQGVIEQTEEIELSENRERASIEEISRRREELPNKLRSIEDGIREDFERTGIAIDEEERRVEGEIIEGEPRIREQFEKYRRELIDAIKKRDSSGLSRISRGLNGVLEARDTLSNIKEGKFSLRRLRRLKEVFDSGAYKAWI